MKKKTVVLGITGGIAAVKIPELITLLRKDGINVIPIMTESAGRIINPKEIEKITNSYVYTNLFTKDFDTKKILDTRHVDHITIADSADFVVVVPATANILAKLAHGIADDFLTTTLLAVTCPILLCPSMNVHMWSNSVVQDNVTRLKHYGYILLEPVSGMLACGYEGSGRLPEIKTIYSEIKTLLGKSTALAGKTVLVTTGGTVEKIDEVRTLTNRSSGKMGVAIAEACFLQGAMVILLRAKHSVVPRYAMEERVFETADELASLLHKFTPKADICFHVAAVSDFAVQKKPGKISSDTSIKLTLLPRQKLYREIKKTNPAIVLITFKAEWKKSYKQMIKTAQETLMREPIDGVVVNDVGKPNRGFEGDMNEVIVVKRDKIQKILSLKSKRELAREIVELTIL